MRVYVVFEDSFDNYFSDFLGVFSTEEKAQAYIDSLRSSMTDREFNLYHAGICIEEYVLDEVS